MVETAIYNTIIVLTKNDDIQYSISIVSTALWEDLEHCVHGFVLRMSDHGGIVVGGGGGGGVREY